MGTLYYCHGIVPFPAMEEPVFKCSSLGPAEATHCGAEGGFAYRNCSSSHAVSGGCPSSMLQASIVWSVSWARIVS